MDSSKFLLLIVIFSTMVFSSSFVSAGEFGVNLGGTDTNYNFGVNMVTPTLFNATTINNYGGANSTYNATYDSWSYNQSLATFAMWNSTWDNRALISAGVGGTNLFNQVLNTTSNVSFNVMNASYIRTDGSDFLSFFDDEINSSSGAIMMGDGVIQLFGPTTELYFGNIITKGPIEPQTEGGHYWLSTSDGFDIGLINGSFETGITDRFIDFNVLDNSGTGWSKVMTMFANGSISMMDNGDFGTGGNITANDFFIPAMDGGGSYSSLNDAFNLFNSAGRISGGEIVENATGTAVIVTAGEGIMRIADDDVSQVKFIQWSNSSAIDVPTDSIMYFGVDYNGGTPIAINTTNGDTWFDLDTQFPLGTVINQGGVLHILNNPWWVGDGLTNVIERFQAEGWLERDDNIGGLILGYTGTRNPTLTAGTLWSRLTEHEIPTFDSTDGDDFNYYYRDGAGSWNVFADQTQWNITHWDDGDGGLEPIGNNQYAVIWVWINTDPAEIALMYPQATYSNSASAEAEEVPNTFPAMWYKQGVIAGRIIIREGEDIPLEIQSAFTQQFTAALAADHGNLAGLSDDDHTQYALVDGSRNITGWDKFYYNQSLATFSMWNSTWDNRALILNHTLLTFNQYNSTWDNRGYIDSQDLLFNVSITEYVDNQITGLLLGNNSWNQSLADTLYASIEWGYNQTEAGDNRFLKLDVSNSPLTNGELSLDNVNVTDFNSDIKWGFDNGEMFVVG